MLSYISLNVIDEIDKKNISSNKNNKKIFNLQYNPNKLKRFLK